VDNGSSDNCTIATKTLNVSTFNCSNVGPNTVQLTVTDVNGNVKTENAIITVQDTIKPTVITQNLTRYLDASGNTSITPAQVDNGSTDNCTIATKTLNVSTFNCSNVGPNTVQLTVTDVNGNVKTESAIITVQDTIKPTVITQNLTRYLDASGNTSITPAQVDNGSSDNCTIATKTLNISSFDCSNVGPNTVYLIVTDVNGNIDSTTATITVLDTLKPIILTNPIDISLGYCDSIFTYEIPTASDNCGVVITQIQGLPPGSDFPVGTTTNTFEIVDPSGNTVTTSFIVEITPRYLPFALIDKSVCQNEGQFTLNQGINEITFYGTGMQTDQVTFNPILSDVGNFNIDVSFIDSMSCITIDSLMIEVRPTPILPEIVRVASDKIITSITYNNYQWYRNGDAIENATNQLHVINQIGVYSILVGNQENCFENSASYGIGIPVNDQNVSSIGNVKVYPNPTDGIIFVEINDEDTYHTINISTSLGITLYSLETISKTEIIDLSSFVAGTYFINIISSTTNETISVIKQ
jgi:hypothetical protein